MGSLLMASGVDPGRILKRATEMARGGDAASARRLFAEVCHLDPANETAWLWRASLATTKEEGARYVEEVLRLNPGNTTALSWMKRIDPSRCPAPAPSAAAAPTQVAAAAAPARAAEPQTGCFLCGHRRELPATNCACGGCGGWLSLQAPATFALNRQLKRDVLEQAVERLTRSRTGTDPGAEIDLAIAHLNLLDYHQATTHLQAAHRLNPHDARLESEQLLRYLVRPVVMAVDDSATVREYIVRTLGQNEFLPIPVANSYDTVPMILKHRPSMVVLDVTMPVMDGHQVCKAIRANKEIRNLPVVMLSGHDDLLDKVVGKMAGATEYLTKPFKPEDLVKTVRKYAKDRAMAQEGTK